MQPHELFWNVSPIITRNRTIFINRVEYFAMLLYKGESMALLSRDIIKQTLIVTR